MKTLMLGLSMLGLFSFAPAFSNGDKDCCKKNKACTEAEKAKCAADKKCLELCADGKHKECKEACEKAAAAKGADAKASADTKSKSCCKK